MKELLLTTALIAGLAVFSAQASRPIVQSQHGVAVESALQIKAPSKLMQPRLKLGDSKVIKSQKIANGAATLQIVQDADGFIYKRYLTKDRVIGDRVKNVRPILKAAGTPTYFEDFESYREEYGYDWIPPTMTEKNLPENIPTEEQLAKYDNLTWMTYFSGLTPMLPGTTDGANEAFIHFDYDRKDPKNDSIIIRKAREQDEWLITPAITPKENDNLYFLAAVEPFSAYNTDSDHFSWEIFDFIKPRECVNSLSVMITEDDGKSWVEAWNIEKEVFSKMSNEDVLYSDFEYNNYKVDLTAYKGKTIKIAFRYWRAAANFNGNSMCLDAIMVGVPESNAAYRRPNGALMAAFSPDYLALPGSIMVLPPYVKNKWYNASGTYADTFEWEFEDPENPEATIVLNDANPQIQYEQSVTAVPSITASVGGNNASSYIWGVSPYDPQAPALLQYGGNMLAQNEAGDLVSLGLGNFDVNKSFTSASFGDGQYCFGTGSADIWGGTVDAIVNYFSKPAAPYTISSLWVQAEMDVDPDTEFTLIVHKMDDWGYMRDTLAVSTCFANQAIGTTIAGDVYYSIPFNFYKEDEFGYEVESYLEINSAVMVEFKGFNNPAKVRMFAPFNQLENCEGGENNCFAYFIIEDMNKPGTFKRKLLDASQLLIDFNSSFLFETDALFNWMVVDDKEFVVPVEGGSKEFTINTFFDPQTEDSEFQTWWIESDEEGMDEWLTTSFTPSTNENLPKMTITASALPQGVDARTAQFTLNSIGASAKFSVVQGEAGVKSVVASQVNARMVGEELVVNCTPGVETMEVYAVTGQLVGTYHLPASGHFAVSAGNLEKGLYMVRFSNNQVVKFIK